MQDSIRTPVAGETDQSDLPAGDFSSWLRHARNALRGGHGTDVACGECTGCCRSSLFIHIALSETAVLSRIPTDLLVPAPGRPKGQVLMGYDSNGLCPMLTNGKCSIYENRPQTCRTYDCRIFTAAGIEAGDDDRAAINRRVKRWKFGYDTERGRTEHLAVQAVAKFVRQYAQCFPGGRVPTDPIQLAIIAIKAYGVFLTSGSGDASGDVRSVVDTANAIVESCRAFDREPASCA